MPAPTAFSYPFITPAFAQNNSIIQQNVATSILPIIIQRAQDVHIQQVLGQALYVSLQNQYQMVGGNGELPVTGTWSSTAYSQLFYMCQQGLAVWVEYGIMKRIHYKLSDQGVVVNSGTNQQPATLEQINALMQDSRNEATFYDQRIKEQIMNNLAAYPEYMRTFGIDRIRPKRTTYFSGFYVPRWPYGTLGDGNPPSYYDPMAPGDFDSIFFW